MPEWTYKRFPGCDDQTFALMSRWPKTGAPAISEVLKSGKVWCVGEIVVKVGSYRRLARSADAFAWLRPIQTPEPLVLGRDGDRGVLAMRKCPGVIIAKAWDDPAARAALADLIAALYRRRIVHGDISPRNVLWDGGTAWLIDLDGLRNPLHGLFWRRHLRVTWAWLLHRLPEPLLVRAAHERCCLALGLPVNEQQWQRVVATEKRI
jgi:hypothetical protein